MPSLTLYQFPGENGLSLSPFCNKVHWALRLKGLPYRTHDLLFPRGVSATGKLPVLAYDGERVHDSTEILRLLEARHPEVPLVPREPHEPNEPRRAALAHVLEGWGDDTLHEVTLAYRWRDPAGLARMARAVLPAVPPAVGALALRRSRRNVLRKHPAAFARTEHELAAELERHLDALEALLAGGGKWLVEGTPSPTIADVSVAAQLHALTLGNAPDAHARLRTRTAVSAWLERFLARAARVAE